MTPNTAPAGAITAMSVLFEPDGSPDPATSALTKAVIDSGATSLVLRAARRLSSSTLRMVDGEVALMARRLLDVDLGGVLIGAWRRYTDLTDAARRTVASPGSEEVLVLATHRISTTHSPGVDLRLDGRRVHTFEFRLAAVLDVTGVAAVVREGGLVALQGGECEGSMSLFLEEERLAEQRRVWEPALLVSVDPPVNLVSSTGTAWPE